ncbi:hypothetical protein GYMLUDRAFT_254470 [Collybiopsis luxurians FD-317 M1]|nr:hypothetical protein GYMLUDRAFT_254470 [Collybiopsis luxurians FD-317 M1]
MLTVSSDPIRGGRPRAPTSPDVSSRNPLLRSVSAGEPLFRSDSLRSLSFSRPSKSMHAQFPVPSAYPDPYPSTTTPYAPSSTDSSTASTRSSTYTNFGSTTNDLAHVHVPETDDNLVGLGITSDSVVQLLGGDTAPSQSRAPIDQTRWSEIYPSGSRSRSSSVVSNHHTEPKLREQSSYDMSWSTVDERDEIGLSEDETDDDHLLTEDELDVDLGEEERTSAVIVAEEGRGLIVQANNASVIQLQVQSGTTHLLIGSSTTPNAMPSFLTSTIPQISTSLLALDISANFLGALPPVLALCHNLEELNIASNPLRVLPVFLADLTNLRVLIADATGITTLPDPLVDLDKVHTISVRRNKMHALPSWLCLLPALQALYVDGNPFQGPWKALVEPLLARVPMTPAYPLSTPTFPLPSSSAQSSSFDNSDPDPDDFSDPPSSALNDDRIAAHGDDLEDHTITPDRAPFLGRRMPSEAGSVNTSTTASSTALPPSVPLQTISSLHQSPQPRTLTRTRTTPNRSYHGRGSKSPVSPNQFASNSNSLVSSPHPSTIDSHHSEDSGYFGDHEIRKMKSAGDLRRGKTVAAGVDLSPPERPTLSHYATTSHSSSNLLQMGSLDRSVSDQPDRPGMSKRFASLGVASTLGNTVDPSLRPHKTSRPALTNSIWDNISEPEDSEGGSPNRVSPAGRNGIVSARNSPPSQYSGSVVESAGDSKATIRARKDGKEKNSRWGFLKKMSMGKMKPDPPPPLSRPGTGINTTSKPQLRHMGSPERDKLPQIDMRFSTTGALDVVTNHLPTVVAPDVEQVLEDDEEVLPPPSRISSTDQLGMRSNSSVSSPASTSASPSLLSPPEPTSRAVKRRSFLPIDINGPGSLNIPIPDNSRFVPGVTATNGEEGTEYNDPSVGSPEDRREPTPSQHMYSADIERKEEERARESYTRALRSVMAYLKDMNDLGLSQNGASPNGESGRSRRPTMVLDIPGGGREVSVALSGTTAVSSTEALRTLSVATTDSTGSNEERKIKDDKSKRTMVAKEILITERTYVKGLQELMDIYIKPACASVTVLSGVSSTKENVVPAPERKIVFGAVDALISFHKESFLPSLEKAVAPLMKPEADKADVDGQLSLSVAISVGEIFWKYAAFMRMYSTYINNFDSAVQRVKYWSASSSNTTLSPSSSSSQLASMGLAMSGMANPTVASDAVASAGAPSLSSGQRKRIRQYLKRCRLNPQHSQLNLESYLLLPIQRIPRYRLLLEDLRRSTPLPYDYMEDQLDRALNEISQLANNMNEGKREAEARRKLVTWQSRIRGKFPSPLVQPHRRLIMDGPLMLTRVVRKAVVSFEAINAQGDACTVDVDCLAPELTPRPLLGILCNDLLVLCRDPSEGQDPTCYVDLWAVLRMQTLPQPASIVHGNALRLVDNKAILYFDAPSASDALNWYRAINLHIPASKS